MIDEFDTFTMKPKGFFSSYWLVHYQGDLYRLVKKRLFQDCYELMDTDHRLIATIKSLSHLFKFRYVIEDVDGAQTFIEKVQGQQRFVVNTEELETYVMSTRRGKQQFTVLHHDHEVAIASYKWGLFHKEYALASEVGCQHDLMIALVFVRRLVYLKRQRKKRSG